MAKYQVSFSGVDSLNREVMGCYTINAKTQWAAMSHFYKVVEDKMDVVAKRVRVSDCGTLMSFPLRQYHLKGRKKLTGNILIWASEGGKTYAQIETMIRDGKAIGNTDHCYDKPFQCLSF
jgi:hypothetical protein